MPLIDKEKGESLSFTTVFLEETSRAASTDNKGNFNISNVPAGTYKLKATFIGYQAHTETIIVTGNLHLEIVLKGEIYLLDRIEIQGNRVGDAGPFTKQDLNKKELQKEKVEEIKNDIKVTILNEEKPEIVQPKIESKVEVKTEEANESKIVLPMLIGINDKFRFINELFKQNNSDYNIAIEQLNTLKNWRDTEIYLNSLRTLYEWKENNEVANHFFSIAKKRFS